MLRKDDLFEVVFYPGTDEVEKQGLGPAPASTARDTGCTAQPSRYRAAELDHSIGVRQTRQFGRRDAGGTLLQVPVGEGFRSRNPDRRGCDHASRRRQVWERVYVLATAYAQDGSPNQEQG